MPHELPQSSIERRSTRRSLPAGVPDWVSQELWERTFEAWQDDYGGTLTAEQAIEILQSFNELVDVLKGSDGKETICSPGKGV